ncbi:MAG: hypothetical protein BRD45_03880 [Bacteroidetes bacterium QS_8_64_10]|jgi:hypothetical protein|nr:MAG: hypothetical protein BRD40_01935 [Bacteroidetes bacterium QS_1_65_9]PSQ89247.1 MAG: hypothetical protein BRD45_03880 [Bacteroidetes bacterium QS_8_64_10]
MDFYAVVAFLTLIGFAGLAALLLVPVYLFLKREEQASKRWTRDALRGRLREKKQARSEQDGDPPER